MWVREVAAASRGTEGEQAHSALSQALPSPPRPQLLKNLFLGAEREEGEGETLILEGPFPVLPTFLIKQTNKQKQN